MSFRERYVVKSIPPSMENATELQRIMERDFGNLDTMNLEDAKRIADPESSEMCAEQLRKLEKNRGQYFGLFDEYAVDSMVAFARVGDWGLGDNALFEDGEPTLREKLANLNPLNKNTDAQLNAFARKYELSPHVTERFLGRLGLVAAQTDKLRLVAAVDVEDTSLIDAFRALNPKLYDTELAYAEFELSGVSRRYVRLDMPTDLVA